MKVTLQNLTKKYPSRNKKQPQDVIAVNDFSFESNSNEQKHFQADVDTDVGVDADAAVVDLYNLYNSMNLNDDDKDMFVLVLQV